MEKRFRKREQHLERFGKRGDLLGVGVYAVGRIATGGHGECDLHPTFPDHVMALAISIAPSAEDGLCLNLEIEAREPGEVWQLQLSRACSGTTSATDPSQDAPAGVPLTVPS